MTTEVVTISNADAVSEATASETTVEAQTEAVTTAAEAAVEIAEIEAARDVAIAEIHAETQVETTAAIVEAETARHEARNLEMELDECRQTIATQQTQIAELTEQLQSIQAKLTPAESPPPSLPENVSSEATQDNPEAAEPTPERAKKRRLRWI